MIWINCRERLPVNGQEVWYWGEFIGVWRGRYVIDKSPEGLRACERFGVSPHTFVCSESWGVVDIDDAPRWMPYEPGDDRPAKPGD